MTDHSLDHAGDAGLRFVGPRIDLGTQEQIAGPASAAARWMERVTHDNRLRRQSPHIAVDVAVSLLVLGVPAFTWVLLGTVPQALLLAVPAFTVVWVLCLVLSRAYEPRYLWSGSAEMQRVAAAAGAMTLIVLALGWTVLPTSWALPTLGILALLLTTTVSARRVLRIRAHSRHRAGEVRVRVLAVGPADDVRVLSDRMRRDRYHGWNVVAACTPDATPSPGDGPVRLGGPLDVVEVSARCSADVVLLCPGLSLTMIDDLRSLQVRLEAAGRELAIAPPMVEAIGPRVSLSAVCGLPVVRLGRPELTGPRRAVKSIADRFAAIVGVVLLMPLLLALAVAVRLDSRGHALFRQVRIGKDGTPFTMVKFRTMFVDAEERKAELLAQNEGAGVMFKMRQDPRVTRVGSFLRRTSLDELPQLLNIVRGDMSVVGPRPCLPEEAAQYDDFIARRLLVRPGLTGLWQVHGRSDLAWRESRRLDVRYVENWSLGFDLTILVRTVDVVLRGQGAY